MIEPNFSHGDYLANTSINVSGLRKILKSPEHYLYYKNNPEPPTKPMQLGTAFHCAILEPDRFNVEYISEPEGINKRTNEGKKILAELAESGKTILSQDEMETILAMRKQVHAHPLAGNILMLGKPELSVFTEINGEAAKCRMDWHREGLIADIKTTDDASPEGFTKSIVKYGYDMQAAWYIDCASAAGLGDAAFVFIAIEKSPPYAIGVYALDEDSINAGRKRYEKALNIYKYCTKNDDWFGYSTDIVTTRLPNWYLDKEGNYDY